MGNVLLNFPEHIADGNCDRVHCITVVISLILTLELVNLEPFLIQLTEYFSRVKKAF